jgi:predicted nucleic acid-binding protein
MPNSAQAVVTNTTPLIALAAATGNLEALHFLYSRVVVPYLSGCASEVSG